MLVKTSKSLRAVLRQRINNSLAAQEVLAVLLGLLTLPQRLSLEPACALLGALARDLQGDFLPQLPRVLAQFADLVDEGARDYGSDLPMCAAATPPARSSRLYQCASGALCRAACWLQTAWDSSPNH